MTPLVSVLAGASTLLEPSLRGAAEIGRPSWGPLALLADLELRLGLPRVEVREAVRLERWHRTLAELACDGPRFYAAAFARDPHGTAQRTLALRDELVLGGWDGEPVRFGGERLDTLHELYFAAAMAPGVADRLQRVEEGLCAAGIRPYAALHLAEPPGVWPGRWQHVFAVLDELGIFVTHGAEPRPWAPSAAGDLAAIQAWLREPARAPTGTLCGDGSFVTLDAETPEALARAVARLLRAWDEPSTVIVREGETGTLDQALTAEGLASQGVAGARGLPPVAVEEAGRIDHVDVPAGLGCERDTVVWWHGAARAPEPAREAWRDAELSALRGAGVVFADAAATRAAALRGERRVVLAARKRLVLAAPRGVAPAPAVWGDLHARFAAHGASMAAIDVDAGDDPGGALFALAGRDRASWASPPPLARTARPPYRLGPSRAGTDWPGLGRLSVIEVARVGERLALGASKGIDWDVVGDAVHAFLAADVAELAHRQRLVRAGRLIDASGLGALLTPASLLAAGDNLRRFALGRWPDAIWHRELPVAAAITTPHGRRRVQGTIDLLLETQDGVIIIDHKSYAGPDASLRERAQELAPQLAAYAEVLRAAGKRVIGRFIYFALGASAVSLG